MPTGFPSRPRRPGSRPRRRAGRAFRRAFLACVASAALLLSGIAPAVATTDHPATISWSGIWHWLTTRPGSLNLPHQQSGTARGLAHQVPASATRAHRGSGRKPGLGHGQLPPFRLHRPTSRITKTSPNIGNGAHSFNPATSKPVRSRATATSTLYRNADGTYTRLLYTQRVNFRGAGGAWQPIKTTLMTGPAGWLHEQANSLKVTIAPAAANPTLVSVGFGPGQSLTYGLAGAAPVPARASGSTVTYRGVLPQTDLTLTSVASGLKESLVLRSASAPSSWTFPLHLTGLTPYRTRGGAIGLRDGAGATVGQIPPATMRDSKFNKRSGLPASSTAVTYRIITLHGAPALRMTASRAWLEGSPAGLPGRRGPQLYLLRHDVRLLPEPRRELHPG